jgi:ABC-type transporter Mla subunit MlaD
MPRRAAIARQPQPEDPELFRLRAKLAVLRSQLAAREADLDRARAQLNSFEGRYIRQVGVLYIQLDDWEDRTAQLNNPTPPQPTLTESEPEKPEPDPIALDLKSLFREVAKRIHPDRARSARDELHRNHLMSQANAAFLRSDADLLQRMLNGYDPATDSGDDSTPAAQLQRLKEQIAQTQEDIATINSEIETLARSEMADLRDRTVLAARDGRDLLAELAARVKGSIGIAMRRYELELGRIRRHQPAFNPEPLLTAEQSAPPAPRAIRSNTRHRN